MKSLLIAESEFKENIRLWVIPSQLSAALTPTSLFKQSLFCVGNEAPAGHKLISEPLWSEGLIRRQREQCYSLDIERVLEREPPNLMMTLSCSEQVTAQHHARVLWGPERHILPLKVIKSNLVISNIGKLRPRVGKSLAQGH